MREPQWRRLLQVREAGTELAAVAHRRADLVRRIAHDERDLVDARRYELTDGEVEDGRVRNRHQLLGARIRERPEPAALAARQYNALHRWRL